MRCVLVNDANLKTGAHCSHCGKKIGDSYTREIGSRFLYCDYACYRGAVEAVGFGLTALTDRSLPDRAAPANSRQRTS